MPMCTLQLFTPQEAGGSLCPLGGLSPQTRGPVQALSPAGPGARRLLLLELRREPGGDAGRRHPARLDSGRGQGPGAHSLRVMF